MAAAYAALNSVFHIIEQIQHHPCPPIFIDQNLVKSLIENVNFLQDFLEDYSHIRDEEADHLWSRIAEAAYAIEDVIESHVVDQIRAQSTRHGKEINSNIDFYHDMQKVMEDVDCIKKEVMEIKDKMGSAKDLGVHTRNSITAAGSSTRSPTGQNTMVGCDDVLEQLMDTLTSQRYSNLQVIPIVGMGGIGKTTLAKNVSDNSIILLHFDMLAWVTISQEYSVQEILLQLLCYQGKEKKETLSGKSESELGVMLYKSLCDRKYLIVMDDMWSIEAWNTIKFSFPDNNNGSRIIVTTRLSSVALYFNHGNHGIEMNFLDDDISWNLLRKIIFEVEGGCSLELEKIGKEIAKNCKGLPLAIVVIGGLLAKSEKTPEYWNYIANNLNSIVNLEDNERCLNILHTSYNHLPAHLKPCFLYMGIFKEDDEIRVSELIKLWVAEGILRPIIGKSLEKAAEVYLKALVDRNLILVDKWSDNGEIKLCKMHDLLRDLCLREAEKDRFLSVTRLHGLNNSFPCINTQRRIAIHQSTLEEEKHYLPQIRDALQSAPLARSLICNSLEVIPSLTFKILRILKVNDKFERDDDETYSLKAMFRLVNSRCLLVYCNWASVDTRFLSSIYLFWNLQTLIVKDFFKSHATMPFKIWKMPQLRHVELYELSLSDPKQDDFVLENLQTLSFIEDFRCGEEVVKRIPNIRKLKISYTETFMGSYHCLNNLENLHKLEYLNCNFLSSTIPSQSYLAQNLTFPHSLKNLTLEGSNLLWEDISTKIGSLPLLQVLKLKKDSFIGAEWETIEDKFSSLKVLKIEYCDKLECWTTDCTHFPHLERLVLRNLYKLKEIPRDIGEIPTLKLIEIMDCSNYVCISAKKILEEQEELGNEDLQVQVRSMYKNDVVESLAGHNFLVHIGHPIFGTFD